VNNKSTLNISIYAKLVFGGLVIIAFGFFVQKIYEVLVPFAIAFVLAYVLAPIVDRMEARGLSRTISILIVLGGLFATLAFFGFSVGKKISTEIIELTDRMHREEESYRQIGITNTSNQPLTVSGINWIDERPENRDIPFSIEEKQHFPIEITPGVERILNFKFSPDSLVFCAAILEFSVVGRPIEKFPSIQVLGNTQLVKNVDEILSVNQSVIEGVILSSNWIDFGEAGPNILTDLAVNLGPVQPFVSEYMGDEFNLVAVLKTKGRSIINKFVGNTAQFVGGVVSGLTFVVIVPFVAFFFLREGRGMVRKSIALIPNPYFELTLNVIHKVNHQIGGYIRGTILATSIVAILSIIGLSFIGLKYAFPIGLLAGLSNMIPFLGPLIGIISASLVALITGGDAVIPLVGKVVMVFAIIQVFDNVIVQPAVVARSVEMHPLMVLFVVMIGSQLMGVLGMLVAVPMTGILKVIAESIYETFRTYRR
jgi:predicted PurR-regulated permease PerM